MIKISCRDLERIRVNPLLYGQTLANGLKDGGGRYGMFQYFKSIAQKVHQGKMDVNQGLAELGNKFSTFEDTKKNKIKQEELYRQFVDYCNAYEKKGFIYSDGEHNMNWNMTDEGLLFGRTPWISPIAGITIAIFYYRKKMTGAKSLDTRCYSST
jgi:hypothetical protein